MTSTALLTDRYELTMVEVADAINRVERNVRANVPEARVMFIEPDVHDEHRATSYVTERVGHIDVDDPDYATITGRVQVVDVDDEIWVEE